MTPSCKHHRSGPGSRENRSLRLRWNFPRSPAWRASHRSVLTAVRRIPLLRQSQKRTLNIWEPSSDQTGKEEVNCPHPCKHHVCHFGQPPRPRRSSNAPSDCCLELIVKGDSVPVRGALVRSSLRRLILNSLCMAHSEESVMNG